MHCGVDVKFRVGIFLYVASVADAFCADGAAILKNVMDKAPSAATVGLMADGVTDIFSGMAERAADTSAQRVRDADIAIFRCRISGVGGDIKYNDTGVVPRLTDGFLADKSEYLSLAKKLKSDKEALGLPPGIESYEIIDDTSGLYDYSASVGIVSVFNTPDDADEKIARGLESVRAGVTAALAANVGQALSGGAPAAKNQSGNNVSKETNPNAGNPLSNNAVTTTIKPIQSTNNITKEKQSNDVTEQCPAKYCKGGSEYTDDETCEAWKLCGCQEGVSPDDVCATERGQELCECE